MPHSHSAVIYFHGVGDPQRHVSLGNFLDHFDLYGQRQDKRDAGQPRSFKYEAELFPGDDEVTNYVEFKRVIDRDGETRVTRIIRVYEGYWVPEARSSFTVAATAAWLAGRVASPIRFLKSPWRAFPAIRLLSLFKLAETYPKPGHLEKLERLYRDFENWESRSRYPKGTYAEFQQFIQRSCASNEAGRLLPALELWRKGSCALALRHLAKLSLLFGFVILTLAVLAVLVGPVADILHEFFPSIELGSVWTRILAAALLTALALALLYRSARTYIFDVISWTLESERNYQFASRERVMRYSQGLIRKVAAHPDCDGITIVSHSLGSCIATEALLREGAREKALARQGAKTRLHKVKSIFTVGSPLDLIFFFFQADQTFSHRYNRIAEEKRFSISLPPFWFTGRAGTATIYNVWSRFDPISSSMQALRKRMSERRNAIVNVEVLPQAAPSPIGAHTSYFADANLMSAIYSSVMGTEVRLDGEGLKNFFDEHPILKSHAHSKPWVLPTIALFGMVPGWKWLLCVGWLGGTLLIARSSNARLLKNYEKRFGRFLRRDERSVDKQGSTLHFSA